MSTHAFLEFKKKCEKNNLVIQDEKFNGCFTNSTKFYVKCEKGHITNTNNPCNGCNDCNDMKRKIKKDKLDKLTEIKNEKKFKELLNKVKDYKIGDMCFFTNPCQHQVTLYLENGEKIIKILSAVYIIYLFRLLEKKGKDCSKDLKHFCVCKNIIPIN